MRYERSSIKVRALRVHEAGKHNEYDEHNGDNPLEDAFVLFGEASGLLSECGCSAQKGYGPGQGEQSQSRCDFHLNQPCCYALPTKTASGCADFPVIIGFAISG